VSDAGRKAANARWDKTRNAQNQEQYADGNAELCDAQCGAHKSALRNDENGNAPSPSPSPNQKDKDKTYVRSDERTSANDTPANDTSEDLDSPAENPSEDGGAREKDSGKGIEYTLEFEEFWRAYPRHVAKKDAYAAWKA
jgi:hypothetical protein